MRGWYAAGPINETLGPHKEWEVPKSPNEIAAFRLVHNEAEERSATLEFAVSVASKYHATVAFLKKVIGPEKYESACRFSGCANGGIAPRHNRLRFLLSGMQVHVVGMLYDENGPA